MSKMSKIVETALDKKHREYVDDADKADEHMQSVLLKKMNLMKYQRGYITLRLKLEICLDARW